MPALFLCRVKKDQPESNLTKFIKLPVQSGSDCAIAYKLYFPGKGVLGAPVMGAFIESGKIQDDKERRRIQEELMYNIPIVRVQGGNVDVH